jgi:hypothetical protein
VINNLKHTNKLEHTPPPARRSHGLVTVDHRPTPTQVTVVLLDSSARARRGPAAEDSESPDINSDAPLHWCPLATSLSSVPLECQSRWQADHSPSTVLGYRFVLHVSACTSSAMSLSDSAPPPPPAESLAPVSHPLLGPTTAASGHVVVPRTSVDRASDRDWNYQ